jgi:hypothetical protein
LLGNKSGTIYVFSKNGAGEAGAWNLTTDKELSGNSVYGNKTPIGSGSPIYTRK